MNAHHAGFFMAPLQIFNKPALTIPEQIAILKNRNLIIEDEHKAAHHLKYIGYYRLSGYLYPFRRPDDSFMPGTSFEQVFDHYVFDRKLRLMTFDAIERIEIALRSCVTNVVGSKHGAQWFTNASLFTQPNQYKAITQAIDKVTQAPLQGRPDKRDLFIQHYYASYSSPPYPPSWMVLETLSIGTVSLMLKYLRLDLRKDIALLFGIDEKVLVSWIHALVYTRNLCAHHSRLWNRVFTIKPLAMQQYYNIMLPNNKFYAQALIIELLLKKIAPNSSWEQKLCALFAEHTQVNTLAMGFSPQWKGFGIH